MKPYPIQVTRSSTPLVKFSLTFFEIDEDTNNVGEDQSKFDPNFIFEIGKSKAKNLFSPPPSPLGTFASKSLVGESKSELSDFARREDEFSSGKRRRLTTFDGRTTRVHSRNGRGPDWRVASTRPTKISRHSRGGEGRRRPRRPASGGGKPTPDFLSSVASTAARVSRASFCTLRLGLGLD